MQMLRKRKFPIKLTKEKSPYIREEIIRNNKYNEITLDVTYALTAGLTICMPSTLNNGQMIPITDIENKKTADIQDILRVSDKRLYYSIYDITYLCRQYVKIEGKQVIENRVNLYIPFDVSHKEVIGQNITNSVPLDVREKLAQANLGYIRSRTKVKNKEG